MPTKGVTFHIKFTFEICVCCCTDQVGRVVTRSFMVREDRGSNLGPVKSNIEFPTVRHRCNISMKGAVLPRRNDAQMGYPNSLLLRRNAASITKDLIVFTFDISLSMPAMHLTFR